MIGSPTRIAAAASDFLARRMDRRGLLTRAAVVGSAVAVSGTDYVLRPVSAYASVCGHESNCYQAWTAMCCTIGDGVNACPPGSFAGGWWKAVGANLCGGKARYYIDCQAECTKCDCARGSHYCGQHCWNCKPHCADHGTCDNRRTCHNLFRYGQCEQNRHCSGPVLCRAISCTPPWKWADCSRTAATDQPTVTHSAPCLPRWTAIQRRYTAMGSQASLLGTTVHREIRARRARIQRYELGRMYWSPRTGAHYLRGQILDAYLRLGQTGSVLGLPTTDSHPLADESGYVARLEHGAIFRAAHEPKAFALWGPIWSRYKAIGATHSALGYPVTDVKKAANRKGAYAHFDRGAMFKLDGAAVRVIAGDIGAKYRRVGFQAGELGYPQTGVTDTPDSLGRQASFEHGVIVQLPPGEPYAVFGPVYDEWVNRGGLAGPLGYPISDVVNVDETHQQASFEHGTITYDNATGTVDVSVTPDG